GGTPEGDGTVDGLEFVQKEGVDVGKLLFGAFLQEDFGAVLGHETDQRVAAPAQDFAVDLEREGFGDRRALYADEVAGLHGDGVAHQHLGQLGQTWIAHRSLLWFVRMIGDPWRDYEFFGQEQEEGPHRASGNPIEDFYHAADMPD